MADGKVEIGIELDDDGVNKDAEQAGRKAGDSFGEGFDSGSSRGIGKFGANLARLGAAAAAAGAAASIAVGKAALEAYASYEQLEGGIKTLFGEESMGLVYANAERAFETAGMSANQYMETVTGFSASLIQSLGGDTAKAAEYADMAITDMSDNANKMGTSMESIQYAYQGFAKQNYTMLDNLKLGYGGTRAEMERLLADAEEIQRRNGVMVDYTIDSYADVVEAIHVVQDEMGIAGATADEAMTTIQGSVNMAKAAWENWLVAIADSDGDVKAATENLVRSVGAAAANIVPRIGEIVTALGDFLMEETPLLLEKVVAKISEGGPGMASAALDFFLKMATAIVKATPEILKALLLLIASLVVAVAQKAGEFAAKGLELIKSLAQGAKDGFAFVISEIGRGLSDGVNRVRSAVTEFFNGGKALVNGLADGIRSAVSSGVLGRAASSAMSVVSAYIPHSPAKKGPFSGKGWTLYSGEAIVNDLAKGMRRADASLAISDVMGDFHAAVSPRMAFAGASSTTTTYTFGDVHLNAADAQGITAIEQLVRLIETA